MGRLGADNSDYPLPQREVSVALSAVPIPSTFDVENNNAPNHHPNNPLNLNLNNLNHGRFRCMPYTILAAAGVFVITLIVLVVILSTGLQRYNPVGDCYYYCNGYPSDSWGEYNDDKSECGIVKSKNSSVYYNLTGLRRSYDYTADSRGGSYFWNFCQFVNTSDLHTSGVASVGTVLMEAQVNDGDGLIVAVVGSYYDKSVVELAAGVVEVIYGTNVRCDSDASSYVHTHINITCDCDDDEGTVTTVNDSSFDRDCVLMISMTSKYACPIAKKAATPDLNCCLFVKNLNSSAPLSNHSSYCTTSPECPLLTGYTEIGSYFVDECDNCRA